MGLWPVLSLAFASAGRREGVLLDKHEEKKVSESTAGSFCVDVLWASSPPSRVSILESRFYPKDLCTGVSCR